MWPGWNQTSEHFSLTFFVAVFDEPFESNCKLMFRFFSRVRSSWKSSCTLWFVLADVSIKLHCQVRAAASPSFCKKITNEYSLQLAIQLIKTNQFHARAQTVFHYKTEVVSNCPKSPLEIRYQIPVPTTAPPPNQRITRKKCQVFNSFSPRKQQKLASISVLTDKAEDSPRSKLFNGAIVL